jgi:hypothetical protein
MESDNCWKQVLSEVAACVPQIGGDAGSTTGVFNGDRTSCTYTGGPLIDFDDPVLLPFDPDNIAFDVTQNEETCLRFEKTFIVGVSETIKIEVASGTLYSRSESGDCDSCISQTIECPDGSSFNTGNAIKTYMDCDSNPSNWPIGIVEQSGATTVGLDMSGGEEGQVSLFHCEFSL